MDDNQQQSTRTQTLPKQELVTITQELYEHNVELSIRNRTLLTLKEMYDIINKTVGVHETAQELLDAIVMKMNLQAGMIMLLNKRTRKLHLIARAQLAQKNAKTDSIWSHVAKKFPLPLKTTQNICVEAVLQMQRRMTNTLEDVLCPYLSSDQSKELQHELNIQTSLVYPIIFGHRVLGTLVLSIDKHIGSLSRAERDALKGVTDVVAIALEQAKTFSDLRRANKQLKVLDELKDEFVSIASHELRTPMTAIKSYLWMALFKPPTPLDPTMRKYLEISFSSTERLIRLVNDMLTVSRIERKKIELKMVQFDLLEVVQMLYDELKVTATEKNVTFTLEHDSSKQYLVNGDKDKVREIVQNLVGNALKFTPPGGTIKIFLAYRTKEVVTVAVSDTGSGIPKESMSKLFQKFSKIDYSYTHHSSQPGTGLGLYISKQIATLHGGSIEVESKVEVGSTFTLVLPISSKKGGE